MDAIGFALCSGGMPSINGRIVYGKYASAPGDDSAVENINVSWDYGIILAALEDTGDAGPRVNLCYPVYFIPGTDLVAGPSMTQRSESWTAGIMLLIRNVTESNFELFAHKFLYFILISYV